MKISIITPNYNYENFIAETIESVVTQDYENVEHIIVDDGSTDNSVAIIKSYIEKYPGKIKLIEQENMGQTPAINTGLRAATGDVIGWLNSDDTYCPGSFNKIAKKFINDKTSDILFGDSNVIDLNGRYVYKLRHFSFSYFESVFVGFNNTLTSNTVFWRKKLMDEVGLMKESLKCNMDGEYFSRLTYRSKLYYLKTPIANFRKQEQTKAALVNADWNNLINREREATQRAAYNNLLISRILPYNLSFPIKFFLLFIRVLKRIFHLHYIKKRFEIYKYVKEF